jgi:hypothetical protein
MVEMHVIAFSNARSQGLEVDHLGWLIVEVDQRPAADKRHWRNRLTKQISCEASPGAA